MSEGSISLESWVATILEVFELDERYDHLIKSYQQDLCELSESIGLPSGTVDDLILALNKEALCVQEHLYNTQALLAQGLQHILEPQDHTPDNETAEEDPS
jgi:hypothetical protein